ncbi:hypothetical protein BHE74_00054353 [Ensete ventricosum]|nr:hypothetical protein GW17_00002854 [Ensete ventricosum]RWW40249.1 hypothetical protein BHE74_00054353 [Ensete ventricosum]
MRSSVHCRAGEKEQWAHQVGPKTPRDNRILFSEHTCSARDEWVNGMSTIRVAARLCFANVEAVEYSLLSLISEGSTRFGDQSHKPLFCTPTLHAPQAVAMQVLSDNQLYAEHTPRQLQEGTHGGPHPRLVVGKGLYSVPRRLRLDLIRHIWSREIYE